MRAFTAKVSGEYDIYSSQDYDGYIHLYIDSFDPNDQLTNLLAGDDDVTLFTDSEIVDQFLYNGTAYYLVSSAFGAGQTSSFTTTFTGPGEVYCNANGIPTLSQWGIIALWMLTMIFGVVIIRQRKTIFQQCVITPG